ncbi:hypothetical protein PIB30_089608 [Stylosanthes scabra]|uniref:FAR1 domain-containing protein n=1 Tax=Stylosanthes scabra TaxID=79078 RepID=A0ABU6QUH8_9FABA|nr:hypothetical protein [Stylosanthes scabra]
MAVVTTLAFFYTFFHYLHLSLSPSSSSLSTSCSPPRLTQRRQQQEESATIVATSSSNNSSGDVNDPILLCHCSCLLFLSYCPSMTVVIAQSSPDFAFFFSIGGSPPLSLSWSPSLSSSPSSTPLSFLPSGCGKMEAASLDPSIEVDSDRSHESENTEQFSCDVDDQYVPKVGMLFGLLEEARDFYRDYAKCAEFATKIRNTNKSKKSNEILNQLLSCNREGKRRFDVPVSERTKAIYPSNCPAGIPPSKSYQLLVMAAGGQDKLNFIEKDVRNLMTREIHNISEED